MNVYTKRGETVAKMENDYLLNLPNEHKFLEMLNLKYGKWAQTERWCKFDFQRDDGMSMIEHKTRQIASTERKNVMKNPVTRA